MNRYVKDGRQGQLVEKCRRDGTIELSEKLAEHPTLSWVQSALMDDLRFAANTLHSLAIQENELVTRKKVQIYYILFFKLNIFIYEFILFTVHAFFSKIGSSCFG